MPGKCLFCAIGRGEIFAQVLYEDKDTMAFLDVKPRAPGHTMVIPKAHAETILDLSDEDIAPVFLTVKRITAMLNSALAPYGFTIGINHGRVSGQAIDHLHVHVIPRFEDDGGGSIHSVVENLPKESLEEIAKKIKNRYY